MMIVATIGKHATEEKIRKMILSGADGFRLNLSRRATEENVEFLNIAQEVVGDLHSNTKIIIDMPINKIRLGDFDIKFFAVRENEIFTCKSASYTLDCNDFIPINTPKIGELVMLHQVITMGDGEIAVQVIEIVDSETIKIKILNNGILQYLRTFNLKKTFDGDKVVAMYRDNLNKFSNFEIDYVAISCFDQVTNTKIKQIPDIKKNKKIILKIEDQSTIDNLENILKDDFYDMILFDRGEVGVNMPFEQVGIIQKNLIELTKKYNKPLLISTQIMESIINNFIPSKAEVIDLTNMVLDNIHGIVFCRETGMNNRPAYAFSVAKKIISEVEKYKQRLTSAI